MAVRKYKPTSPARRFGSRVDYKSEITKNRPEKNLSISLKYSAGRNSNGRITSWHKGNRHKRRWRLIDFRRDKDDIIGKVIAIEYDPNRSANIALVQYPDGEKRYILHPLGLKVGDEILSGENADFATGNNMKISQIPLGTFIHNVELISGQGAKLARSAGTSAQLLAKEGEFAHLKMPSGEVRMIRLNCRATIGQLGNIEHINISLGSAGRKRHMGIRPTVRGTAMNSVDHPHGGGRGRSKGGNHPMTPWGTPTKGYKTRKKKESDKYIITRRKKSKKKK